MLDSFRANIRGSMEWIVMSGVFFLCTVVFSGAQEPGEEPGISPGGTEGSPTDTRELPPKTPEDRELEEELGKVYSAVEALGDVQVAVHRGVVRLSGEVERPGAREAAERIAGRLDHTLYVDNRISVAEAPRGATEELAERTLQDEEIHNTLTTIFNRVDELQNVRVDVQSGVVRLSGETASSEVYTRAENLARELEGVRYVDNDITVHPEVSDRLSDVFDTAWNKLRQFAWYLPLFLLSLVVVVLFWWIARWIVQMSFLGEDPSEQPLLQSILRQVIAFVIFLVGVLFVLELFEVTTLAGALLGGAGLLGLVLGFAFRDIAENYLASVILGFQQPFRKNDMIEVGEYQGKVVRMTIRETVLMTLEGNHVRVPNSLVFKKPTYNYTRNPKRRFEFSIGVGGDEDLIEVHEIGLDTLRSTPGVLEKPTPEVHVDGIGDSAVNVSFSGWLDQREHDWRKVRGEAIRRVKSRLDAGGIDMPEPIYRIRTSRMDDEVSSDQERRERAEQQLDEPGLDVGADTEIDSQIEVEREESGEQDLLEE